MSHTTTIKSVKVTDIGALRSAVAELKAAGVKVDLREKRKPRMFYENQHGVCDYVVTTEGKYDIGFEKQADGSYAPVFDTWGGHIGQYTGATCAVPNSMEGRAEHAIGRLMQGYAKHAAINTAVSQGYMVESTTVDDKGNVQLVLTGM